MLVAVFCSIVLLGIPSAGVAVAGRSFDTKPSNCTIEPRTLDELQHIISVATPAPLPKRPSSGAAIASESDTGTTVIATIEQLFSCLNGGDRLRAYALYTDAYLVRILQPSDLPAVATPYPLDTDEYTQIVAIELHAADRDTVIAKVTLDPALIPVHKIFEFILIPTEAGWRIDQVINEIDFSVP